jgi:hypothetical protein
VTKKSPSAWLRLTTLPARPQRRAATRHRRRIDGHAGEAEVGRDAFRQASRVLLPEIGEADRRGLLPAPPAKGAG